MLNKGDYHKKLSFGYAVLALCLHRLAAIRHHPLLALAVKLEENTANLIPTSPVSVLKMKDSLKLGNALGLNTAVSEWLLTVVCSVELCALLGVEAGRSGRSLR